MNVMDGDCERGASVDLNDLMATLIAVLRSDRHLRAALTRIVRGNWQSIEAAVAAILAPRTLPRHLDAVARDILALICDGRGVIGPIVRDVFFDTVGREVSRYQAMRLREKIRRLWRKVAAADLALQQPASSRKDAEIETLVQPQIAGQGSIATPPGRPSDPVARPHTGLPVVHAPAIEFGTDGISVDAALIADGLGLDPASVPTGMRIGEIRAVCERGIDADDGLYRLTFSRPGHRVRLVVDTDGQVRKRSSISFGDMPEAARQLSA